VIARGIMDNNSRNRARDMSVNWFNNMGLIGLIGPISPIII
jgi:hypothetical protein